MFETVLVWLDVEVVPDVIVGVV
ncbi:hypothetical protein PUN4_220030 [Paraburkholderia unamae]|nr:hypothetical protein PUN4_220030 [Paraburkholderia unamae]